MQENLRAVGVPLGSPLGGSLQLSADPPAHGHKVSLQHPVNTILVFDLKLRPSGCRSSTLAAPHKILYLPLCNLYTCTLPHGAAMLVKRTPATDSVLRGRPPTIG